MNIFSKVRLRVIKNFVLTVLASLLFISCGENEKETSSEPMLAIATDNAGVKVPEGFGVIKVADSLGKPRHFAVTPSGGIYVKLREPLNGNGILYLTDNDGDGVAESKEGFGDYKGTGMNLDKDYLYASSDETIFRYRLDSSGKVTNPNAPDTVVTGLINRRSHATKSFTLDDKGNIYVNIGAYSNACRQ